MAITINIDNETKLILKKIHSKMNYDTPEKKITQADCLKLILSKHLEDLK